MLLERSFPKFQSKSRFSRAISLRQAAVRPSGLEKHEVFSDPRRCSELDSLQGRINLTQRIPIIDTISNAAGGKLRSVKRSCTNKSKSDEHGAKTYRLVIPPTYSPVDLWPLNAFVVFIGSKAP